MKSKSFFLFLIICFFATLHAQEFRGYVKKADSTSSPVFQAKVDITENDKAFKTLKTYFDGSFKFTPNKSQTYLIKISYSGYTDTAYSITADKNAKPSVQNVIVKLKKDGMRLMGMIKSREEDFPIKGATVVVRNVMTRKEERITTDIDGKYNFKLEYETNYKVWIDKRSTGIFNVYKDTSFYISTIGFNQPLDYKLDISLDAILHPYTTVREGYDASKKPENKNLKPVINIVSNDTKPEKNSRDTLLTSEKITIKKTESKSTDTITAVSTLKSKEPEKQRVLKKKKESIDVVVIRDNVKISTDSSSATNEKNKGIDQLEAVRQKALTEKKAREEAVELKKGEEKKKKEEICAGRMKFIQDSIAKQKIKNDSLLNAKLKNDSISLEIAKKQKMKEDSAYLAKVQVAKAARELAAKQKTKQDSILKAKTEQVQLITKQKQVDSASILKPAPPGKVAGDSDLQKKQIYLSKTQEQLIAAAEIFAKRKKFVQDSIAKAKETELKKEEIQQNKK